MKKSKRENKTVINDIKRNMLDFVFCVFLFILYFVPITMNMFTFHFIHANIFHLLSNIIVLWAVKETTEWWHLPAGYAISSVTWQATGGNVVGFSAILYFILGATFMKYKNKLRYLLSISAILIMQLFIPSMSFKLHFFPFASGIVTAFIIHIVKRYRNDINKLNEYQSLKK